MARALYYLKQKANGNFEARKRRVNQPDALFDTETTDKKLAVRRADAWVKALAAEKHGDAPAITFGELAERYATDEFQTLKIKTAARYAGILSMFLDDWEAIAVDKIDSASLAKWEAKRRKAPSGRSGGRITPNTIGFEMRVLSAVFAYARRHKLVKSNPAREYREELPKKSDLKQRAKRRRYLTKREEAALLLELDYLWRPRVIFALETGIRKEELFSLLRTDIDLDAGFLTVRAEVAKTSKRRKVPLTDRARKAYAEACKINSIYAFPKQNGSRVARDSAAVLQTLWKAAEAAGVEGINWHDLRRTCGVRLLRDRKLRIEEVSVWLGHDDVRTTQASYAFLDEEEMVEQIQEQERVRRIRDKAREGVR